MKKSSTPSEIILSAQNLAKSYILDSTTINVFEDLSLDIHRGEHISIMGASGSGKSTLLTLLAVLDKPTQGKIIFDGTDITDYTEDEIAKLRRSDFGFVFQSFHLIPSLTALENVMFPLQLLGQKTQEAEKAAMKMLEEVNLVNRAESFPHQLSGGEKQRVAIARALIHKPRIVFADEPTGNLDEENSEHVLSLLLDLREKFNITLIVITHEREIAEKADRTLFLERGAIKLMK